MPKLREGSLDSDPGGGGWGWGGHLPSGVLPWGSAVPSEMPVGEWKPTDAQDRLRTEHKPRAPA